MTTTPTEPARVLTALDRCDRCGAQAYVLILMPSGFDLLFCGHHAKEHGDALLAKGGSTIIDERSKAAQS